MTASTDTAATKSLSDLGQFVQVTSWQKWWHIRLTYQLYGLIMLLLLMLLLVPAAVGAILLLDVHQGR